jgi:outer membrane protein TolC
MKHWLCVGLLWCAAVHASPELAPYLPVEAAAKEALIQSPLLQQARARKQALGLRAQAIDAGSAEFSVRALQQRRSINASGERYGESSVSLERPVRLWGKRGIDAELAKQTQTLADIEYADAMHEASRELLKHWFAFLRAGTIHANANTTLELAQTNQRLAGVRLKHGEISQLDAQLAQAELQRTEAAWQLSQAELNAASTALQRRYPSLPLPNLGAIQLLRQSQLPAAFEQPAALHTAFLQTNHELNMLRIDAQRLRLHAQRVDRERLPDPTLGIFTARDRAGAEQVTGVSVAIAFAGDARSFQGQAALAEAQAADDKVATMERNLSAAFDATLAQYQHKRMAATQLQWAAQTQALAAEKSRTAFSLGEHSMSDMLTIARVANDNRLAADLMRVEVIELLASVRLDLHEIWDFDE